MVTKVKGGVLDESALSGKNMTGDIAFDTTTLKIDASNNRVGVGTASPSAGLHTVVDNNPVAEFSRGSNNTTNINLDYNTTLTGQLSAANAEFQISAAGSSTPLEFFTNGSERMRIDSSGHVLIGKTSGTSGNKIETDGRISAGAGSTGQPTFNCEGDTNTGINLPESDRIQFITGGSERMRVDSDGRLAINNTTTAADSDINDQVKLVCGGGVVVGSAAGADNANLQYTDAGGLTVLQGSGTYGLRVFDDNSSTPRFTVMRSGNVGIGITDPDQALEIGAGGQLKLSRADNSRSMVLFTDNNNATIQSDQDPILIQSAHRMVFNTNGGNEAMRIDTNGNVSIGGGGNATNFSNYVTLDLRDSTGGLIDFSEASAGVHSRIQAVVNNSLNILNRQNYPLYLGTNDTTRLSITGAGNVIVGGTSDSAAGGKFQIHANKSYVAGIPLGVVTIEDTASMAAGVGGSIVFTGAYLSNGTKTSLAFIEGRKEDGTSGNYGGELAFGTRINGGNADEYMRLTSNGTLHVDNNLGAHTGTYSFAHNTYNHAAVFGRNSTPDGTVAIEDYDVSSGIGNTVLKLYLRDQDPATHANFINFGDGGGSVGSITHNDDGGGVTYNTTSDYRLKENVDYNWDGTTLLKQLKPAKFNFTRAPGKTIQGMLAHEVMDIVPSSVRGEKDHMMDIGTIKDSDDNIVYEGVYEHFCKTDEGQTWTKTGTEPYYQELDYSRLVPLLVKTIQELEARLTAGGL